MDITFANTMKHDFEDLVRKRSALWSKCYPKAYKGVNYEEYYSAKIVGYYLLFSALKIELPGVHIYESFPETAELIWASKLSRYQVPIFWISREIVEALKLTQLPMTLDLATMKLPFEAAVFMLPNGSSSYQGESDVVFVSYVRDEMGENIKSINPGVTDTIIGRGCFTIFAGTTNCRICQWHSPLYKPLDIAKLDETIQNSSATQPNAQFNYDVDAYAKDFMAHAAHLIFNALQLILARPNLVSMGSMIKEVRGKKNKPSKIFWSPNLIGSDYKLKREPQQSGGSHASPRGHWVRGFWRNQAYGENFSQHKDIWIEPFWRG